MVLLLIITQGIDFKGMAFLLIITQRIDFKGRFVFFVLDVRFRVTPLIHAIKYMDILQVTKLSLDPNATVLVLPTLKVLANQVSNTENTDSVSHGNLSAFSPNQYQ